MRKILIPTDFSDNAMNAIRYALELFKFEHSEFFIIHAFADEVYESNTHLTRELFDETKKQVKIRSDDELLKILDQINSWSPNPKHQYHILSLFGTLIDETNELVDKENIDVLVMGTKGKTDDRDLTFGSNTLQVLKYVKCPVLSVPAGYPPHPPKKLLFPSDFLLPFKKREMNLVSTLAKSFGAEINFLHLLKCETLSLRQKDHKAFLESCMKENIIHFHQEKGTKLTAAINSFIEFNKMDMLIMVNSRHSFLEDYLYRSTIDEIGLHIKIPFLVVQNLPR